MACVLVGARQLCLQIVNLKFGIFRILYFQGILRLRETHVTHKNCGHIIKKIIYNKDILNETEDD